MNVLFLVLRWCCFGIILGLIIAPKAICPSPQVEPNLSQIRYLARGSGRLISENGRVKDYQFVIGDRTLQAAFVDDRLMFWGWQ